MGDDVQLEYEIKYDQNLDHTIKYFKIRHGTYLEEEKLADYFGRQTMEESMLSHKVAENKNGKSENSTVFGTSKMTYDDLWIDTQSKLIQIMELNSKMIREDGAIIKKYYNVDEIYGLTGITVEEVLRMYSLIFGSRIPFAFLGFVSPRQAIRKLMFRLVRRRNDLKLVYV